MVECVAPAALHIDRFLPPRPIRVLVDHASNDLTNELTIAASQLEKGDVFRLLDRGAVKKKILPAMYESAIRIATEKMQEIVTAAGDTMSLRLQEEIERLEDLQEINCHVPAEEIAAAKEQREALRAAMSTARLRLDGLRLIFRVP